MADNKITIIRTKHNKQTAYFCMSADAAQDEGLSWEARGVLAYLLSKPPDWKVMVGDLKQKCGKDKVYRILKELEDAHYLRKEQVRRPDGTFEPVEYRIYESPSLYEPLTEKPEADNQETVEPLTGLPETAKPLTEKPEALLSIESNQVLNNTSPAPEPEKKKDEIFEAIAKVWKTRAGAFVGQIKTTMLGTARKGDWRDANFDTPATPDEILLFGKWWGKHHPELTIPSTPEKIQRYFYEFRAARERYKIQLTPVTTDKYEPPPADAAGYNLWLSKQMGN